MAKYVGAHVSAAGGVDAAPENAHAIDAKAFALFVKNQKTWFANDLRPEEIASFKARCEAYGYTPERVLPHDSYLINLGNPDDEKQTMSFNSWVKELQRCEQLGLVYLNFHPGAHLKLISEDECIARIADCINRAHDKTRAMVPVIENTAGQGSAIGWRFEHLAKIIERVEDKTRIGVCLDTCHTFAAGYDLRTREAYEATMSEFEKVVGFKYLKGVHLNDSKPKFASRVDRHECIGKGEIGLEAFRCLMNDPRFDDVPMVLETPEPENWAEEIKLLYGLVEGASQTG